MYKLDIDYIPLSYNKLTQDDFNNAYSIFSNSEDVTKDFVRAIEVYTGLHATALNSGTSGIHLALKSLGIGIGDEVLCPTFTFAASANPILYEGATPVFVESEKETWNISPEWLETAIADRLKQTGEVPKALILVHIYGMPARIDKILEICERFKIPIIEDAAEALGSTWNDQVVGAFGEMGVYSFNNNKLITSFGGGMLVSADQTKIDFAEYLASQAKKDTIHYEHGAVGYNYKIGSVNAAFGLDQLSKLEKNVTLRTDIRNGYIDELKSLGIFQKELPHCKTNAWLTSIKLKRKVDIIGLCSTLLENEHVETRPLWMPMHLQPAFKGYTYYGDHFSEELFNQGLCLPSSTQMNEKQMDHVLNVLKKYIS